MKNKRKLRFLAPLWFLLVAAALGAVVMLLWNWLMPAIFGLATITFWQALGLFLLARILVGGFRKPGMMGGGMHAHQHHPFREKWEKMTPEQQKEFIAKRKKFGFGGPFGRDVCDKSEHRQPHSENE